MNNWKILKYQNFGIIYSWRYQLVKVKILKIFISKRCINRLKEKNHSHLAKTYLLKVSNRNTRRGCEICSRKIPERSHWCRSGVFIVNFKYVLHFFLVFLLLRLNEEMLARQFDKFFFYFFSDVLDLLYWSIFKLDGKFGNCYNK